ncbi:hypothetical protein LOTGIDRAFT_184058 [Lottia gigantea]|uniref:Elongation of very long chain fatty acids protein n=1 Tax=Lottia gigantea TaxID=225164 RepID=V3ZSZ9_LOTGI|nr:hypothetical protein LOTGIDRAFT_184058 [Lottia gigantea]ESO84021.1 hypothetical protein LOTGIDRAFT_184058 [Lottia gigantea]
MNSSLGLHVAAHNYSYVFEFEKNWDEPWFLEYLKERWTDSFIYAAVYVVIIFSVQHFMKSRREYDLRQVLAVWSGILALFSISGSLRTLPELVSSINNYSFQYSVCVPSYILQGVPRVWVFLFTISKVYELGDTIFIVLRKKPLVFLHWYHHVTVLIYSWYTYTDHTAAGRWFIGMNYVVHSVMYTYYALKAMQIHVPKQINLVITGMQLSQMVMGCVINLMVYIYKQRGDFCQQTYTNLAFSTLMYFSYFVLFARFFHKTYIVPKSRKSKQH